jgi:hypothetical protein
MSKRLLAQLAVVTPAEAVMMEPSTSAPAERPSGSTGSALERSVHCSVVGGLCGQGAITRQIAF